MNEWVLHMNDANEQLYQDLPQVANIVGEQMKLTGHSVPHPATAEWAE